MSKIKPNDTVCVILYMYSNFTNTNIVVVLEKTHEECSVFFFTEEQSEELYARLGPGHES
jgi:hypothetical protein